MNVRNKINQEQETKVIHTLIKSSVVTCPLFSVSVVVNKSRIVSSNRSNPPPSARSLVPLYNTIVIIKT